MKRRLWMPLALIAALAVGAGMLNPALATHSPGHGSGPGGPPLSNSGRMLVTVHPVEWVAFGSGSVLSPGLDVSQLSVDTPPGNASAGAGADLPTALYGKRLRLVEVQLCYDATDAGVTITQFLMRVDRNATGTTKTNPVGAAVDVTPRTDEACRTYPVDHVLEPTDMAAASVSATFSGPGSLQIGRLTFVLEPTDLDV